MQARRRLRRANLHLAALSALALVVALATQARAQETHIDRLELVEAGFYDSTKAAVTGSIPSTGAAAGTVHEIGDVTLLTEPPAPSARVGIGFGVRFRSFGERNGERAALRSVWKIPAPGIDNPNTHNTYRQSVSDFSTTIGSTHWRGYAFDDPWEVVPGAWTLEIWQGDRKLLEKSFTVQ
jgi:hypothetical protein